MKILIACEESQIVTKAFRDKGYEAYSCDIQETSGSNPEWHLLGNVLNYLDMGWDLMIAHPPCTYLSNVGAAWFNVEKYGDKAIKRHNDRLQATEFVKILWESSIPHICIENPVGWLNNNWMKPTQVIEPYFFGDPEKKRTCLWLKGLPKLVSTNIVEPKIYSYFKNGKRKGKPIYRTEYGNGSKYRSKFFPGIAAAMVDQWIPILDKRD